MVNQMSDNPEYHEATSAMGLELGRLYFELKSQLIWIHLFRKTYRSLYNGEPERNELLTKSAGQFFFLVQGLFADTFVLKLSRITDPPESGQNKANLSIKRLPGCIGDASLRAEVEALIDEAMPAVEFARSRRNRRVAHLDLRTVRKEHPVPIPEWSDSDVESALSRIEAVLNRIQSEFLGSTTAYFQFQPAGSSYFLVKCMELGIKERQAKIDRLRNLGGDDDV